MVFGMYSAIPYRLFRIVYMQSNFVFVAICPSLLLKSSANCLETIIISPLFNVTLIFLSNSAFREWTFLRFTRHDLLILKNPTSVSCSSNSSSTVLSAILFSSANSFLVNFFGFRTLAGFASAFFATFLAGFASAFLLLF